MAIAPRNPDELLRDVPVLCDLPQQDLISLAELAEVRKAARAAPLFRKGSRLRGCSSSEPAK